MYVIYTHVYIMFGEFYFVNIAYTIVRYTLQNITKYREKSLFLLR